MDRLLGPWDGRRASAAACLILMAVTVIMAAREWAQYNQAVADADRQLLVRSEQAMHMAATDIARLAQNAGRAAEAAAALPEHAAESAEELAKAMRDLARRHVAVSEIGIIFDPFAFDPSLRLFAPVAMLRGHEVTNAKLEDDLDPTTLTWFQRSLTEHSFWSGPDRTPRQGVVALLHVRRSENFTVWAAVHQNHIIQALDEVHPADGMALLVGQDGQILATNRATRPEMAAQALASQSDGDDNRLRLLRAGVTGTPWHVVLVVADLKATGDAPPQKSMVMRLTGLLVIGMIALAGYFTLRKPLRAITRETTLWMWSYAIALTFMVAIGAIWVQVLRTPPDHLSPGEIMTGPAAFSQFKRQALIQAVQDHRPIPTFTPTGVFVQAVEFVSASNVVVTGYIWQRFAGPPPGSPGFLMPEADTVDLKEIFRQTHNEETVIGWSFRVTLRQSFGYANFPLDWESVWIRLWPAHLDDTEILIPDFNGYYAHSGNPMPGIAKDIVISGWLPHKAFFEYRRNEYSVNFGQGDRNPGARPELYFNIVMQRTFLDAFVSHMTPIMLVLVLLYAMQMTVSRNDNHRDLLGFNAATIITTCAALFFAVLISHIEVRSSLAAKQIFYIEYFYFITYLVILLACVNAILFTTDSPVRLIDYEDNLIPKLLYWPSVSAAMYGVTAVLFA